MDLALPTVSSVGDGLALALLAVVAVPVTIIDVRCRRIPDAIVLPAVVVALALRAVWGSSTWAMLLLWAMVAGAMLLGPAVIRPDGMGLGDVKLAVLLGACLGALACAAVLLALVAGAVGGGVWAVLHGTPLRDATIPFGPFLVAAALALALPVAFLHSPNGHAHPHHPTRARAAVQPARIGVGGIGWHAAMGRPGAARGARHGCGAGTRCGDTAT
jgi:leader peptidase (prepilin peptidase)/N-methyltransferase